jgi:hypothetical protein
MISLNRKVGNGVKIDSPVAGEMRYSLEQPLGCLERGKSLNFSASLLA